ncbi:MAG TPA: EAL domain-containing protein [Azospirillaceae bacterium]|nr:EAL domain-containing protein [Azospirillaceae bacterium]
MLCCWRHPRLGLLAPGVFVPAAEMSSLIVGLTDWVVSAAARQAAAWARSQMHLQVSVNLSARNLADEDLPDRILLALAGYDAPLERFEFEITETAFLADPRRAFSAISRLTELGGRFAIDDFGTGYASLSTLRLLPPVATLKIDRSFVSRMRVDAADAAVVETIIGLAQRLGIDSVAEGVEDAETYGMLRELKCSEAQGYWIARPAEAGVMTDWLAARGGG